MNNFNKDDIVKSVKSGSVYKVLSQSGDKAKVVYIDQYEPELYKDKPLTISISLLQRIH